MNVWTWDRVEQELAKYPGKHQEFRELAHLYTTFEDWLETDAKFVDIIASVIGCQCAEDLKQQQRETMDYRRTICATASEWIEQYSPLPSDSPVIAPILRIIKRFARQKRCHRNWEGKRAGIRCYCDEHKH